MIVPHAPAWECSSRRSASSRGRGASRTVCDAERRTIVAMIVLTLQRRNAGLDALRRQEDAELPERHATRSAAR
ncbi:hypothetical protein PscP89CL_28090 [Pseudomonas syringae]|nr:hypothetical protein [Pseudomonas syringae]